MSKPNFRPFVPDPEHSGIRGKTARAHAEARMQSGRARELFDGWRHLLAQPFKGITTDGTSVPGLFALEPEGAPTEAVAQAVMILLSQLTPEQAAAMRFPVDPAVWRNWQNTELYVESHGLRLEDLADPQREAVMGVLRASLSARGYEMSRDVMRLNRFLGDLVGAPEVLGEWSYIFCLFGAPSPSQPWGWQLFGHHLCLNCFILGEQMVFTPTFMGAEPAYADEGPFAGISLFEDEERAGLELMRALSEDQREQAIVAHSMVGGDLPPGRRHFADNLHLGGAYQDNRVIPYEGIAASQLSTAQRQRLLDLIYAYLAPLPDGPLAARVDHVEWHLPDTYFSWIGGFGEESAFYYRVHSPIVMIEFDHHTGVFLTNDEPAKFHVHTIVRTPNGNDYGLDLLRLHYENAPHHNHPSNDP